MARLNLCVSILTSNCDCVWRTHYCSRLVFLHFIDIAYEACLSPDHIPVCVYCIPQKTPYICILYYHILICDISVNHCDRLFCAFVCANSCNSTSTMRPKVPPPLPPKVKVLPYNTYASFLPWQNLTNIKVQPLGFFIFSGTITKINL